MRDVNNDAISMLEASIRDAGAELTCDELPTVVGDRAQLVRLLRLSAPARSTEISRHRHRAGGMPPSV
jgi:hypothetical protein